VSRDSKAKQRLEVFRQLVVHLRAITSVDVRIALWDGSTIPADLAKEAPVIVIAEERVVAALMRRPNLHTLLNLWVTARIDIRNGSFFDLFKPRQRPRTRQILKRLDKRIALKTALKFLLVPRGGPWPLEGVRVKARADGSEAVNKANIQDHYDLSNAFYQLFLDPEMVYSCAYFRDWGNDLATAQRDKLDVICRKLRLAPGEHLLDIGCGWGALVCHAARHYGVHAHGMTLAEEQFVYAKDKVARLGLQDKVTIELRDYSRVDGQFDKIASIGMFEHVGITHHPTYFRKVHRLLKPGGLYLHHAIAFRVNEFERIQRKRSQAAVAVVRYIFPGGEVDHLAMSIGNLERFGFEVHDVEAWREHYARTTRLWHDHLLSNRAAAEREVGSVKTRLWLAYLAGVSIGFNHGSFGIFQTLASKRRRGPSGMPPTRAWLYD
jgi:cyclopropane-fatty-acyl-phospholipid synthase